MADQDTIRKLAAILSADVVGYSRLMGEDEQATITTLSAYRNVFKDTIVTHQGRVVDTAGDSVLAVFTSVVEAVQSAVDIQQALQARNDTLPPARRMLFRIGVNLGDVLEQADGSIYGDGVNIAARLEALAEPGGLCIAGSVYDTVHTKLDLAYEALGQQSVKNIRHPVRAYRVRPQLAATAPRRGLARRAVAWGQRWVTWVVAVLLLVSGAVVAWQALWRPVPVQETAPERPGETVGQPAPAQAVRALDKYRLAVLPFVNISQNPEEEYFADGMTEELISHLSKLRALRVIARTSVMQYKGTGKGIADIGRELQVGTILEGSVRTAANQVRITAQLIEVPSQTHLWSMEYDRAFQDIFAIQRDIATRVAKALQGELLEAEKDQLEKQDTANLEAYNLYLKGLYHLNKAALDKSKAYFEQALAMDPNYALAYAGLAEYYNLLPWNSPTPPQEAYPRAHTAAEKALELDDTLAEAYVALAYGKMLYSYDWGGAEQAFTHALALKPNSARVQSNYGFYLRIMGRWEEAIAALQRAQELDPLSLLSSQRLGFAFLNARQYDQAIAQLRQTLELDPNYPWAHHGLAEAYLQKGMYEEAIAEQQKTVDLMRGTPTAVASLGRAYAMAGQPDQARQLLDTLTERAQHQPISRVFFGWIHMGLGELDQAFAEYDKAYEERNHNLAILKTSWYDNLRADPRYQALLQKLGLPPD
jgi:TolB-like protein/class 3 adenylate cyclase/Tfp pilus assembly protein PilF